MRILLSGSTGILGSELIRQAKNINWQCDIFDWKQTFLNTPAQLQETIRHYDFFIHAAANTNVEKCEEDEISCFRDNYLITEILAHASARAKVSFVFISSVGVYGAGKNTPYREFDLVTPTTNHHRSKYFSEKIVLQLSPTNIIIRTGWLFGGKIEGAKNFVFQRIREAAQAKEKKLSIMSNNDQRGVPCFNGDIASRIFSIIESGYTGIFNCVNSGNASRYEYVKKIIEISEIKIEIQPASGLLFNRLANVSNNEMAVNWKMDSLGFNKMPDWQDSLKKYINKLKIDQNIF
jgi:dTDP-4-dehydrorhamnose reductase